MNHPLHAIVIGIDSNTERFNRIHLFESEHGYICVLKRKSSKKISSNNLDLFQEVEIVIQKTNDQDIGFVKEFTIIEAHTGIGKNYTAFDNASQFCRAIQLNARHMPNPQSVFELIKLSLHSWHCKPNPDVTLFKALYRLASEDGFPVKEDWLLRLNKNEREIAKSVLYRKVDEQEPASNAVKQLAEHLIKWLTHQQDFLF
jgi:hypothetical protein